MYAVAEGLTHTTAPQRKVVTEKGKIYSINFYLKSFKQIEFTLNFVI